MIRLFPFKRMMLVTWIGCAALQFNAFSSNAFVNFETAPVHPVAFNEIGGVLAVCNLPDARLEFFDVSSGTPSSTGPQKYYRLEVAPGHGF